MDQVRESVTQQFPQYQVSMRTPAIMVVKKSGAAAALVVVRKNKIIVNEGFASMGGQLVFTLSMLLLGILIPLIIYFTTFYPKQKAVVREVAGHLTTQFG